MRKHISLAVVLAFVAASARADIPLPSNLQYVDPRVAFEGVDKYPDHVFFLRFLTFTGGPSGTPHRVLEIKNVQPFHLQAQRRLTDMKLLAMDRAEFEKQSQSRGTRDWVTDKTPGILSAEVEEPSTVAPKNAPAAVSKYRVTLEGNKLSVESLGEQKVGDATPRGGAATWFAGLSLAAAVTGSGLWFARRK
jgi:hypothetical protein